MGYNGEAVDAQTPTAPDQIPTLERSSAMAERKSITERLFDKVEPIPFSGCFIWMGWIDNDGYGYMYHSPKRRTVKAHRVAWELAFGSIPEGMGVLHRCDVRSCVNPAHLFLGTHADNMRDMKGKSRAIGTHGTDNFKAKLTELQVRTIISLQHGEESCAEVSRRFGVSHTSVWRIWSGIGWKHIER